jgi:ParB/RepB/Spo0J family partition protein
MNVEESALLEAPEASAVVARVAARFGIERPLEGRTETIALDLIDIPDEDLVRRDMRGGRPSFALVGMLHAPSVVRGEGGRYTAMAGARRLLVARDDGQTAVECRVFDNLDTAQMALVTLVENVNRAPAWIRELRALVEVVNGRTALTETELAEILSRPVSSIREMLKLTRLPEPLLAEIDAGRVNRSIAKRLTRLTAAQLDRLSEQAIAGEQITDEGVSEALRTQFGAISAPLAEALDVPDLDGLGETEYASGSVEERDERSTVAPPPTSYASTIKALRTLLRSKGLSRHARALATALIAELE